ncbi:pyridoxine 5'-phosphate synthase [Nitrogeniibacter aestuarii]|uniref:pyridoxine 5'-phosphate synthase n=1 Tax=Nitrogeniibacter aestuarii TaxID=2815343 RepID=UPI001E3C0784|nr:pyridoxine 5'-phosphate synthase [Nitrogeniibacter aestuarii]
MIELGVNIDHVATLRQARRTWEPDPVWAAVEAHLGGADGITVHLREDRRHINDEDVRKLRELTQIKLNLEMAATDEMLGIATRIRPEMAMFVPEGRQEITTEGGLDVLANEAELKSAVARLADAGIMVSVFIDAIPEQIDAAARIGAKVCEVHTGPYAHMFHHAGRDAESPAVLAEIARIRAAGEQIQSLGMRFNAGHALNYYNVQPIARLPGIRELHIGHSIISRAIFSGIREAVSEMKRLMREAAAGAGQGG